MRRILTCAVFAAALAAISAPALGNQDHDRQRGHGRDEPATAPPHNQAVPRTTPPPQAYARRDDGRHDVRGYDGRYYDRGRVVIVPRVVRPVIVGVVPYRPYFYRPTYRPYGYGYYDPYAYPVAPYGYYQPIPGRPYGGVRITGVPRDAQVFADGYYVGIVDDFDGIFQHLNLEAGPHHIEIQEPGRQPIAFDVMVRPGQTITYRAEVYGYPY